MHALFLPRGKIAIAALLAVFGAGVCLLLTPSERWLAGCFLSATLAWAAMIDIDRFILPNLLTISLLIAGLVNAALAPTPGLANAVIGAALGYGVFTALGRLFARILGRPALGQGDAKLMAAGGAWLGWEWLPYLTLIASSCAMLIVAIGAIASGTRIRGARIAFGLYIALAILAGWILANQKSHLL